jgi:hypothetical protein
MAPFIPKSADILQARAILKYQFGLPNELLLNVLDDARYWFEHEEKETYRLVLGKGARSKDSSAIWPYFMFKIPPQVDVKEVEFRS